MNCSGVALLNRANHEPDDRGPAPQRLPTRMRAHDPVGVLPRLRHRVDVTGLERFVEGAVGGEHIRFGFDWRTVPVGAPSGWWDGIPAHVTPRVQDGHVPLEPPHTLSPSKVAAFTDCALAFRFSVIDRLPEPPSPWTTKGTLVHAALERLFVLEPGQRTHRSRAHRARPGLLRAAHRSRVRRPAPRPDEKPPFLDDARRLVRNYFRLEDPTRVRPIGLELMLDADIGGAAMRGIIDRLELDDDGELVVTDYKTGKAPAERYEQGRLDGVHLYSLLCERNFGRRPARVRLLYLGDPLEISTSPSDQSTKAAERKVGAIWTAVERACRADDFRPDRRRLCDYCAFRRTAPRSVATPTKRARVAAAADVRPVRCRSCPTSLSPTDIEDRVRAFDDRVDGLFDEVRGHPVVGPAHLRRVGAWVTSRCCGTSSGWHAA